MPVEEIRRLRPVHQFLKEFSTGEPILRNGKVQAVIEDLDDNDLIDGKYIPVREENNALMRDSTTGDLYVDIDNDEVESFQIQGLNYVLRFTNGEVITGPAVPVEVNDVVEGQSAYVDAIKTTTDSALQSFTEVNDVVAGESTYVDAIKTTSDSALQSFTEVNDVVAGESTYVDGIKTVADEAILNNVIASQSTYVDGIKSVSDSALQVELNDVIAGQSTYVDGVKGVSDSALQVELNDVIAGQSTYVDGIKSVSDSAVQLNANNLIDSSLIGNLHITDVETFGTEELRNSSTATVWHKGDIAIVLMDSDIVGDDGKKGSYIYTGDNEKTTTVDTDWSLLEVPDGAASQENLNTHTMNEDIHLTAGKVREIIAVTTSSVSDGINTLNRYTNQEARTATGVSATENTVTYNDELGMAKTVTFASAVLSFSDYEGSGFPGTLIELSDGNLVLPLTVTDGIVFRHIVFVDEVYTADIIYRNYNNSTENPILTNEITRKGVL